MSEANPYAPPQTEPEVPSTVTWQTDGLGLLAKNGVILPRVDLETGEHEAPLKCRHRILLTNTSTISARVIAVGVVAFLGFRHAEPIFLILVGTCVWFLFNTVMGLRGPHGGRIVVWEFATETRLKRRKRRRKSLVAGLIIFAALIILMPIMVSSRNPNYTEIVIGNFIGGVLVIIGLTVWASRASSFAKTLAGAPGWLRISPVHPQALGFLQAMEAEMFCVAQLKGEAGKRKVRTAYLHRYPLRMLLGKTIHPIRVLRLALMKLLKSKFLEVEFYHYSEATKISHDELYQPLQAAVNAWLANHSDWRWLYGESNSSTAGNLHVHWAVIASPDLAHTVVFSCAWNPASPRTGIPHLQFKSYQMGGTLVHTHDHHFLHLPYSHIKAFRATGKPDQVFHAHFENCSGQAVVPPLDAHDLLARIEAAKEETDRLLTEGGFQGEVRLV